MSWQQAVTRAQQHRDDSLRSTLAELPPVPDTLPKNVTGIPSQLLSAEDVRITSLDVEHLLPLLASGALSSVAVTTAFIRRAAVAQSLAGT